MLIWLVTADFPPNVGGVAAHVGELGKALSELGHQVTVFTLPAKGGGEVPEFPSNMSVERLAIPKTQPFFSWCLGRHLRNKETKKKPTVVHVHGIRPLTATRKLSAPVIFTNHTSGFLKRIAAGKRQAKRIGRRLKHLAHVIAPSEELIEATRTAGYDGPATYVPNGVDPQRFKPAPSSLRKKLGIEKEEIMLVVARRLVPKNGVLDFASSTAWFNDLQVRIVIAGDGPEKDVIKSELTKHDMLEKTIFLGNVRNEEMPGVYNAADLSVLPSHMEATSITGLESLSCALPMVGTEVGGIPELIHSGENGYLVPSQDPKALGAAIRKLIVDRGELKEMGLRSLEIAKAYQWPQIASRTLDIYRSL